MLTPLLEFFLLIRAQATFVNPCLALFATPFSKPNPSNLYMDFLASAHFCPYFQCFNLVYKRDLTAQDCVLRSLLELKCFKRPVLRRASVRGVRKMQQSVQSRARCN